MKNEERKTKNEKRGILRLFTIHHSLFAQKGFTLIELIIASGIFVGVVLVGFAILASNERTSRKTEIQTDLISAAELALETVARDIRFGTFAIALATGGAAPVDPLTNQAVGDRLIVTTRDPAGGAEVTRIIEVATEERPANPSHRFLASASCGDPSCLTASGQAPLSPDGVEVESIEFRGLGDQRGARQPYVTITLLLRASDTSEPDELIPIRTTIASRRSP